MFIFLLVCCLGVYCIKGKDNLVGLFCNKFYVECHQLIIIRVTCHV
jgi:hypothetical protein